MKLTTLKEVVNEKNPKLFGSNKLRKLEQK